MTTAPFRPPQEALDKLVQTVFPMRVDTKTAYLLMRDYTRRFFPLIAYRRLLTRTDEIDLTHGEIAETQKRFSDILQVRAFAIPTTQTQPLTSFGIEEERMCDLAITAPDLVDAGLARQKGEYEVELVGPAIGDHFFYHQREYEVLTCVPLARFANTDIILYFTMHGELFRGNSPDFITAQ